MAFIYDLVDAWNAGGTSFNAIRMNVTDTASAAASRLVSLQINGSERFSVRKDGQGYFAGNVGIGTSSPTAGFQLDVNGTAIAGAYCLGQTNRHLIYDGGATEIAIRVGASGPFYGIGTTGSFNMRLNSASGGDILFAIAGIERMRINSSGNVLVGTSATEGPSRMSVVSTASTTACISYRNTAGAGSTYAYFLNGGNTAQIGSITNSGNTGTAYNTSSDARLKHDIAEAPEASDLIDAIKVRSFKWNVDNSEQRYGFVAQELVAVAPEAVHQPEDEEQMMAVDYSKLVPMLVKEIQSLRARVAQLEGI
jgi:hypothetical protein